MQGSSISRPSRTKTLGGDLSPAHQERKAKSQSFDSPKEKLAQIPRSESSQGQRGGFFERGHEGSSNSSSEACHRIRKVSQRMTNLCIRCLRKGKQVEAFGCIELTCSRNRLCLACFLKFGKSCEHDRFIYEGFLKH